MAPAWGKPVTNNDYHRSSTKSLSPDPKLSSMTVSSVSTTTLNAPPLLNAQTTADSFKTTNSTSQSTQSNQSNDQKSNDQETDQQKIDDQKYRDYLQVGYIVATIPYAIARDSWRNALVSKKKRRSVWSNSYGSLMGHCYKNATLSQLRILTGGNKSLESELNSWMYTLTGANRGLNNYNQDFSGDGFVGRWINEIPNRTAQDPVIVYFHGGGYAMKTEFPQVFYMLSLARKLASSRISIVALDYTITPYGRFPVQRNEGMALVASLQKTCDKVIFFGDSCGGNLGLSLLVNPAQPVAIDRSKVAALVLVSPWVDLMANSGSMLNQNDLLSLERLNDMAKAYCDSSSLNNELVNPSVVKPGTWQQILPSQTLLVYGEDECLHDQIDKWRQEAAIRKYYVESNGTHDCILRGSRIAPSRYIARVLADWYPPANESELPYQRT